MFSVFIDASGQGFDPKIIAGKWNWIEGQQLEILNNGTLKVWLNGNQINSGTWSCTDRTKRSYTFRHSQAGWVDQVTLSAEYTTLTGSNQVGTPLKGTRISYDSQAFDPGVIVGFWNWIEGQQLELIADGTLKVWLRGNQINSGTWTCTHSETMSYTFRHQQGGWVDEVVLSTDRNKLTGRNQQGVELVGRRIMKNPNMGFDPVSIAGTWSWVEGQQLELSRDGKMKVWLNGEQINSGTWTCTDQDIRSYTLRHNQGGWVDQVTLSADYKTLQGNNQVGSQLHGTRIR